MSSHSRTFAFRLDDYRSQLLEEQARRSGASPGEVARRAVTTALQGPSEAEMLYEKIARRLTQLEKKLEARGGNPIDVNYSAARECGLAFERDRRAREQKEWLRLSAETSRDKLLPDPEPA